MRVLVWHLDRLHRQPRELEEFFDVCDAARLTTLASVTGDIDLATHDGQFLARILGAVARRRATTRAAGSGASTRSSPQAGKLVRWRQPALRLQADRRDGRAGRGGRDPRVRRAAAARARRSARSAPTSTSAGSGPSTGGAVDAADVLRRMLMLRAGSAASASTTARSSPTAEWAGDHQPDETARDPGAARRPRPAHEQDRPPLPARPGCCAAAVAARRSSPGRARAAAAATSARRARASPAAARSTIIADAVEEFVVEAVLYRLDSPELAARAERRQRATPDAERWQAEADAAAARSSTSSPPPTASGRSRCPSGSPPASRSRSA